MVPPGAHCQSEPWKGPINTGLVSPRASPERLVMMESPLVRVLVPLFRDSFPRDSPERERSVRNVPARDVRACPSLTGLVCGICLLWPGVAFAVREGRHTEREGFEPSNEVDPRYAISSRARSTAPAPLQAPGSVAAQVACQSPRASRVAPRAQSCQAPSRRTGTSSPAVVMPVTDTSSPPIMKSTWIEEWFRRGWSSSPAVNR
jgi:hypothetical protein